MKTKLALMASIALIFEIHASFAQCTASLFAGGNGTKKHPYQISTPQQLQNLNQCLSYSYHGVLNNDIDLSSYLNGAGNNGGAGWLPITCSHCKFDGKGHKVSGLWINRPSQDSIGLFRIIDRGEVRNIGVEIDNAKGGVSGGGSVGGLVGYNDWGTISNSYSTGSVTGNIRDDYGNGGSSVGGLVGHNRGEYNTYGTISNSYATGSVTGKSNVGGLVGFNSSSSTISNSYYDQQTSGQTDTGKGIGKTTIEMKTQSTYAGWDFESIWVINPAKNSGYPILFWQNPEHIANAMVSAILNQIWTGNPITPKPSISLNGSLLTEGTDFEYSYTDNIQIGTATLIIVGKGTYLGQAKTEFGIIAPSLCKDDYFAGGTGTMANPYKISNAASLDAIRNCLGSSHSGKYYELQNDIKLQSILSLSGFFDYEDGWEPIGYEGNAFSGKFDGKGHKVSGLWIDEPSRDNVGLFGYVSGSTANIMNIEVEIDGSKGGVRGGNSVGGLVGKCDLDCSIENSFATGSVAGNNFVGGLVGKCDPCSYVKSSFSAVSVNGTNSVGGLIGYNKYNSGGQILNSFATGSVSGTSKVGGLIGENYGYLAYCYATGSVTGNTFVGGLLGSNTTEDSHVQGIGGGGISGSYYPQGTGGEGEGRTEQQLQTQGNYAGWDFVNTWHIDNWFNNKTPYFQWQNELRNAEIDPIEPQAYTGSRITPKPKVMLNGVELIPGIDFRYEYGENIYVATGGTVSIVGIRYYGSKTVNFIISSIKPVSVLWIPSCGGSYTYNGKPQGSQPLASGYNLIVEGTGTDVGNFTATAKLATPEIDKNVVLQNDACSYAITPKPLEVSWAGPREYVYNKMNQSPKPGVDEDELLDELDFILLNANSAAGEYTGDAAAAYIINPADPNAGNYRLRNNRAEYTISKKPLKLYFADTLLNFEGNAAADTLWAPREIFSSRELLQSVLSGLVSYSGFATDTISNASDDASALRGAPSVALQYPSLNSSFLAKRVETTQTAVAVINTDGVSADNYALARRSIVIMETIDESEAAERVFCFRGSYCTELSGEICAFIKGEEVAACSNMRKSCLIDEGICINNMLLGECVGMGGTVASSCDNTPIYSSLLPASQMRVWQTASGVVNVDLGYMPGGPALLQVYNLKGKLVASEQVNSRFASVKINAGSGIYLFKIGNRSLAGVVK
jgi:hypothetical protein